MIRSASASILITGYSLSDYFSDLVDEIILKSQRGVFVKFFVNDIEHQTGFDRVLRYKGRFLRVYNYPRQADDKMAALHAKVISVDKKETLITSANLSYHGQEGNLELGTYIESPAIARQIDDVFTQLILNRRKSAAAICGRYAAKIQNRRYICVNYCLLRDCATEKMCLRFRDTLICISQSTGLQFLFMGVSGIDTRAANTLTCRKAGLNSGRRNL